MGKSEVINLCSLQEKGKGPGVGRVGVRGGCAVVHPPTPFELRLTKAPNPLSMPRKSEMLKTIVLNGSGKLISQLDSSQIE